MKRILQIGASLLVSCSVFAQVQTNTDPTMTAKYWVDLYRKKNELQNSYINLGYKADLEIQKIDKLLDLDEQFEKLQDLKDECEESLNCSDEKMVNLYKKIKMLDRKQNLISAADEFVEAENDQKKWQEQVKKMPLSEIQRKNLLNIVNRRVTLKANKLFVLDGKKTATDEEIEKWDEEFDRLSEALFSFNAGQQNTTKREGSVVFDGHDSTKGVPYLKSVCESYIEKYKNAEDKKQFVEHVQRELADLNRNYPEIPADGNISDPESKVYFGLDGKGRIVSFTLQ